MKKRPLEVLLFLFLVEALIVGCELYSRQLEGGGFLQSGYSALDLVFLFGIMLIVLAAASFLFDRRLKTILITESGRILENQNWLAGIVIVLSLLVYESFQDFLFIKAEMPIIHYQGYRNLLTKNISLLGLIFLSSCHTLLFVIAFRWLTIKSWINYLFQKRWAYICLGLIVLILGLNFSGYGFIHRSGTAMAQTMNAPLLGIQVILIAGLLLLGWWVYSLITKRWPIVKSTLTSEFVVVLGLWLIVFLLWINTPLGSNYYIDIPRAPNYELYPNSDLLKYDIQAQGLLVGGGLKPNDFHPGIDYVQHPMHSLYLAILHGISGEGFDDILYLQVAILSFIPVLLYKLGSLIHTRFSGLIVSLLYSIRERNALFLGEHITVSNAKTLMTEPLALLGLLVFLYLLLLWMRTNSQKPWLIFLSGGVLGFVILIRVEVLAMIPVIGLATLIYFRRNWNAWLRGMAAMSITILIMITPWMIRNYKVEGRLSIDKVPYIRWKINNYLDYFFPDEQSLEETPFFLEDINRYHAESGQGKTLSLVVLPNIANMNEEQNESPTEYFLDHFVNNLQQTIYYLPNNHQPLLTIGSIKYLISGPSAIADMEGDQFSEKYLERYVKSVPYWWYGWDGKLVPRSFLPLASTLVLISVGFSQVLGQKTWITTLLIFLILTQSGVYAVLANSGGRFIAIVDWIPLLFYGIGLSILLSKVIELISGNNILLISDRYSPGDKAGNKARKTASVSLVLVGIVCAGLSLPLSEILIPAAFTQSTLETQLGILKNEIELDFLINEIEGLKVLYGKALYPRYFKAGDRMKDDRNGTIPDYSYNRVEFYLVGTENTWIALPSEEQVEFFPHGSDVIIFADLMKALRAPNGRMIHGNYYQARLIVILKSDQETEYPVIIPCSGNNCALEAE